METSALGQKHRPNRQARPAFPTVLMLRISFWRADDIRPYDWVQPGSSLRKRMRSIPETCRIWGPRKVRRLFGERRNGGASESPHKTSSASAGAKDAQPVTTTPRLPRFHTVARRYFTASAFARSDFIAPKALRSTHFFILNSAFFIEKISAHPGG